MNSAPQQSIMESLPDEIILAISKHFGRRVREDRKGDVQTDIYTIVNAMQVNSQWQRVFLPLAYFAHHEQSVYPPQFSELLAMNPELPPLVKHLTWLTWGGRQNPEQQQALDMYSQAITQACPFPLPQAFRDNMAEGVYDQDRDCLFAFILIMCKNLEVIRLPNGIQGWDIMSKEVIRQARQQFKKPLAEGERHILGSVRHLELAANVAIGKLDDTLNLLSLPELRYLKVYNIGDGPAVGKFKGEPLARHPIHLTFDVCLLTNAGLSAILAACAEPRSLMILNAGPHTVVPGLYGDALRAHGESLRSLFIQRHDSEFADATYINDLGSALSTLTNLVSLSLRHSVVGTPAELAAVLPPSLVELMIFAEVWNEAPVEFGTILGNPRLPNLKRVIVVGRQTMLPGDLVYDYYQEKRCLPPSAMIRSYGGTVFE
ncbi:hypothetical protein GGR54DRAFT_568521 [Hypoxylon sp. NC1633]|nr:hypothetical protein GGR54DRAFT_568521 [Hypoxylon sp. NC1633]